MSIKKLKEYKWRKNFTQNIGLKGHFTAVHEKKFNFDQCGNKFC